MATQGLERYDLVTKMSPFWDAQMLLPVLQWLQERNIHPADEIDTVRNNVLNSTNIVDSKKAAALKTAAGLEYYLKPYITALNAYKKDQQNRMGASPEKKTIPEFWEWYHKTKIAKDVKEDEAPFQSDINDQLFQLSDLFYQIGDYKQSKRYADFYLHHVCELIYEGDNNARRAACHWEIAASVILNQSLQCTQGETADKERTDESAETDGANADGTSDSLKVDEAAQSLLKLAEMLDSTSNIKVSRDLVMVQRSWILHWAIWILFRYYFPHVLHQGTAAIPQCWNQLMDWLVDDRNAVVIQLVCPHITRYYTVYGILNRKRKDVFQLVVKLIGLTKSKFSDPFTLLLEALFVNFNFDVAQQYLSEIVATCSADFFLEPLKGTIEEQCRLLIFEIYCRIHKSINLDMIAEKLNMTREMAERWIVNLIRTAKLEAKIDSEKNRVEMTQTLPTFYQQIYDKTRMVTSRDATTYQDYLQVAAGKTDGDSRDMGQQIRFHQRSGKSGGGNWSGNTNTGGRSGYDHDNQHQQSSNTRYNRGNWSGGHKYGDGGRSGGTGYHS